MTEFEIKTLADMICFKFRKAGIVWDKRYVNSDINKTYKRTKLYNIQLEKFLESDLPEYLKRKKIKYTLILKDRSRHRNTNGIAFYLYY